MHLCFSNAIPWTCLAVIYLNEDETTSSSHIFIKILFQELAEYMGLVKLNERLHDLFLAPAFDGLLPRDNPTNMRFSINFFASFGLGGLTDDLREHLKVASKMNDHNYMFFVTICVVTSHNFHIISPLNKLHLK